MGQLGREAVSNCVKGTTVPRKRSQVKLRYTRKLAFEVSKSAQSFESVHALRLMIGDD